MYLAEVEEARSFLAAQWPRYDAPLEETEAELARLLEDDWREEAMPPNQHELLAQAVRESRANYYLMRASAGPAGCSARLKNSGCGVVNCPAVLILQDALSASLPDLWGEVGARRAPMLLPIQPPNGPAKSASSSHTAPRNSSTSMPLIPKPHPWPVCRPGMEGRAVRSRVP